ncbi:unnamed protein product, partial [Rotaria sp. Silwood1]
MCEQYLPLIIDQVSSLCLSDSEETPQLPELLIHYGLTIDEFTHLRSLLIQKIDSSNTIFNITSDCFYLPYLTHLKIIECHVANDKNSHQIINNIWRLPRLKHCTLDVIFEGGLTFAELPIISTSIEYLLIKNVIFSSIGLTHLLNSTSYLQHLCIQFGQSSNAELDTRHIIPSIISLKLNFDGSLAALTNILQ